MGVDMPTEILFHISQYIPDNCLREMLGVNRLFYNIAMNLRYRDVVIATGGMDPLQSVDRLHYAEIARRVRVLKIHLSLMRLEDQHQDLGSAGSLQLIKRDFNHVITQLSAAFPAMINVQALFINSWHLHPQYNLHPFLTSLWSSFGRNLHTFSMEGNLEGCRVLTNSTPSFESLKHLGVSFANNIFRADLEADRNILVGTVAPFINRLGPQLVSLRVWSWATLDLSAFFMTIGPFPQLQHLNVRTAFSNAFRANPVGLQRLLCGASSTLRRIDLHLNPAADPMSEGPLCRWLLQCLEDERCFANVRALDIYPTNQPVGMDFLLRSIERTAKNLTALTVRDHYLKAEEVNVLLEALMACKSLRYSRLNAWRMNVALFDIMAMDATGPHRLSLSVSDTVVGGFEKFIIQIRTRSFPQGTIKDLTIWRGGGDTVAALAHSIPSVNSFWGNGNMELE